MLMYNVRVLCLGILRPAWDQSPSGQNHLRASLSVSDYGDVLGGRDIVARNQAKWLSMLQMEGLPDLGLWCV